MKIISEQIFDLLKRTYFLNCIFLLQASLGQDLNLYDNSNMHRITIRAISYVHTYWRSDSSEM